MINVQMKLSNQKMKNFRLRKQVNQKQRKNKKRSYHSRRKLNPWNYQMSDYRMKINLIRSNKNKFKLIEDSRIIESKPVGNMEQYNNKRNLLLVHTCMNQKKIILQLTKTIKQTKVLQTELEFQLKQFVNEESPNRAFSDFCHRSLQRLSHIVSSEQNLTGNTTNKPLQQQVELHNQQLKLDSCLASLLNKLDENENQKYLDASIFQLLSTISIQLIKSQQVAFTDQALKFTITPIPELLNRRFQRVSGIFTQIFPFFNNEKELILRQIQNDSIMQVINQQDKNLNELLLKPELQTHSSIPTSCALMLVRSINVLRSLIIHLLIQFHVYQMNPQLNSLKTQLIPFVHDCLEILTQYDNNENNLGPSILWGLWQNKQVEIKKMLNEIQIEMQQLSKQYHSVWKDLMNNNS